MWYFFIKWKNFATTAYFFELPLAYEVVGLDRRSPFLPDDVVIEKL